MVDTADTERSGAASILWNGRWIIAGTVLASATASFAAANLLHGGYTARIELVSSPERMAAALSAVPVDPSIAPDATGESATLWGDALARFGGNRSSRWGTGVEGGTTGPLVVWARADDSSEAARHAAELADRLETSLQAAAIVAATPSPSPVSTAATLEREIAAAREERDRLAAELERDRAPPADKVDVAALGEIVRDLEREEAGLRRDLATRRSEFEALRGGDTVPDFPDAVAGATVLRDLALERTRLETQVASLSRTLLDAHPRMMIARLRLQDVDQELRVVREDVAERLQAGLADIQRRADEASARLGQARRDLALATENDEARRERERSLTVAQEVVARMEAASQAPAAASPAPAPTASELEAPWRRTVLPLTEERIDPWPGTAAGAGIGFLASTLGLLAVGTRPRRIRPRTSVVAPIPGTDTLPTPANNWDEGTLSGDPIPGVETASVDDVIDAIVSSGVARTMMVTVGEGGARPLSVDIVRRLALRGKAAVLVDLSADQRAARAMGSGTDDPGLHDLLDGRATFASIARHDFATQADIVPAGVDAADRRLDTPQERRNVLDFIERSYDALLLDCGAMEPERLREFMEPDAALLVAVGEGPAARNVAAIQALRSAGLDDLIVVREARAG